MLSFKYNRDFTLTLLLCLIWIFMVEITNQILKSYVNYAWVHLQVHSLFPTFNVWSDGSSDIKIKRRTDSLIYFRVGEISMYSKLWAGTKNFLMEKTFFARPRNRTQDIAICSLISSPLYQWAFPKAPILKNHHHTFSSNRQYLVTLMTQYHVTPWIRLRAQ